MKSLVLVLLCIPFVSCFTSILSSEFITGFESGIFLRDSDDIQEQYGCPEARAAGPLGNLKELVQPLRMMSGFVKDKNIEEMLSTVEVFIESLSSLMAVFTNYEGGDFCSGVIFGSHGA